MLRSYHSSIPFTFAFGNRNIQTRDARILYKIEKEINNMTTKVRAIGINHTNANDLVLKVPGKLNLIIQSILNQYDIEHFEHSKWCGCRKITYLKIDKLIFRIINNSDRIHVANPLPIDHIISNAIDIQQPSPKSHNSAKLNGKNPPDPREFRRVHFNENRGEYRRSRGLD